MRSKGFALRAAAALAGLAIGAYGLGAAPAAQAATVLASGMITSGMPNKCLQASGSFDRAAAALNECDYSADQVWNVMSDGTLQNNGRCLDVSGGGTANETKVQLYTCNSTGAQQWQQSGDALVNPQSGRCLDDPGATMSNGAQLQIYDCNGTNAQDWALPSASPITPLPGQDFVFSMDDGGLDPGLVSQVLTHGMPLALGLPDNPALSDLIQAEYRATHGATTALRPPGFSGGSLSVSGSTITVDIPANVVGATVIPDWLASVISAAVAITASGVAWALCTASLLPAWPTTQPLCWAFGTFVWSLVGNAMGHALFGTAGYSWTDALIVAVVSAAGSYLLTWAGPAFIKTLGGKLVPVWKALGNGIKNIANWLGSKALDTFNYVSNKVREVITNWQRAAHDAATAAGLAVDENSGIIYSGMAGKCLDAYGVISEAANNTVVDIYDCNYSAAQTSWTWFSDGSLTAFGKCLDTVNHSADNTAKVQLYQCDGSASQQWRQTGDWIVNPSSGRCLDDPASNTTNGTQLTIKDCNGGANQRWSMQGLQQNNVNRACAGQLGSVPPGGRMDEGQILRPGDQLTSPNGMYTLTVQPSDGNIVINGPGGATVWTMGGTLGHPGDCLVLQTSDGNLVAYDSGGNALWATGTRGNSLYALMQDDGNFVIYDGIGNAVWATNTMQPPNQNKACAGQLGSAPSGGRMNEGQILGPGAQLTSPNGRYTLTVQASDGNIVINGPGGTVWTMGNTLGHPGDCLILQSDGNLVAYDGGPGGNGPGGNGPGGSGPGGNGPGGSGPGGNGPSGGNALWATGTSGASLYALMQDDGNFVMYDGIGNAVWATNTMGHRGSVGNIFFQHRPPTGGSLGPNVIVFNPGMSQGSIQSQLDAISSQQASDELSAQRYAVLFQPGTYGSAGNPLVFSAGYYTAIAGLGRNPGDVTINGAINVFDQCGINLLGTPNGCYGTTNFWRSISNLTINVMGNTGCHAGTDFWATSQEAPLRRVIVNGNFSLMDYCSAGPSWTSGGLIADSQFNGGNVTNGSQQQFMTRNTSIDSWSNSVWNQVFCGDPGAPAQNFVQDSGTPGGPSAYTTLDTCPATREAPYLYTDSGGNYNVFVPSVQHNSSGPTWAGGSTPGRSLPLSTFFVVSPGNVGEVNAALAAGDNLLFTPGVYDITQTINVTSPDTVIVGLGYPTLVSDGVTTMTTADVAGTIISGLILDAGPSGSPSLLQLGTPGSGASNYGDPATVSDVTFRVGGAETGTTTTAFIDNSNNSILDNVWAWRADHGNGTGSWTSSPADTGLIVNGDNVTATGLFIEHFQKTQTIWNGQGGTVIMFQNEMPYEVPNQAAWMKTPTQNGYPAFYIPNSVTSFHGYGMGSYCFFDQNQFIRNSEAFEAPNTPGVQFRDLLTVFLNGEGSIDYVINGIGPASVWATKSIPSNVISYP